MRIASAENALCGTGHDQLTVRQTSEGSQARHRWLPASIAAPDNPPPLPPCANGAAAGCCPLSYCTPTERYENEAGGFWDHFYRRNATKFFKDRWATYTGFDLRGSSTLGGSSPAEKNDSNPTGSCRQAARLRATVLSRVDRRACGFLRWRRWLRLLAGGSEQARGQDRARALLTASSQPKMGAWPPHFPSSLSRAVGTTWTRSGRCC